MKPGFPGEGHWRLPKGSIFSLEFDGIRVRFCLIETQLESIT